MLYMKLFSLLPVLFLLHSFLTAQTKGDPIYLNYSYYSSSEMKKIPGEASYQNMEANVIFPKFNLAKTTEVYTNIHYKLAHYEYDETLKESLPENLNDLKLGVILRHFLKNNWEIVASPQLNVRTDFSKDNRNYALFPSMGVLGLKTSNNNKNLTYGLGVSYNNDLNKDAVIPLGYLKYTHRSFRVYTLLPSFLHFVMTPSEKFEYGFSYRLESAIYHIDQISADASKNYLKASNITLAPTLAYNLHSKLWINARAGYALSRQFQVLDGDFKPLNFNAKNEFEPSFFANFGFSLRLE